jgi:hypothetical protein
MSTQGPPKRPREETTGVLLLQSMTCIFCTAHTPSDGSGRARAPPPNSVPLPAQVRTRIQRVEAKVQSPKRKRGIQIGAKRCQPAYTYYHEQPHVSHP